MSVLAQFLRRRGKWSIAVCGLIITVWLLTAAYARSSLDYRGIVRNVKVQSDEQVTSSGSVELASLFRELYQNASAGNDKRRQEASEPDAESLNTGDNEYNPAGETEQAPGLLQQEKRVTRLRGRCQALPNTEWYNKQRTSFREEWHKPFILVDDEHKLIYCKISKVGSSNMLRFLMSLVAVRGIDDPLIVERKEARDGMFLPQLYTDFNDTEIKLRLESYTKVILIREPLERVLSAYRDGQKGFRTWDVGKLSFREYLGGVLASGFGRKNMHFDFYYNRCLPCSVQYNFIVTLETLDEDIVLLTQKLNVTAPKFPDRNATGYTDKRTWSDVSEFFSDISKEMIDKFYQTFYGDYFLFGYPYPRHLFK